MDLLPKELQDFGVIRRVIFAAVHLPAEMPHLWSVIAQFASVGSKVNLQPEAIKIAVENLKLINEQVFSTDKELLQELLSLQPIPCKFSHPIGIVLVSPNSKCRLCNDTLLLRSDRPSHITLYTEAWGTVICTHYHKFCRSFRKGCGFKQYYGYSSSTKDAQYYDEDWNLNQFFVSSNETAFELCMLQKFDAELLLGQISYSQYAEIYNYNNNYPVQPKKCSTLDKEELPNVCRERGDQLLNRIRLDRRRFESAHLKYAILKIQSCYPLIKKEPVLMASDVSGTVMKFTPTFYEAFCQRYSEHKCDYPGCRNVLVLDGNMKNRRDVCSAKDAGYVEYPGLPGQIKTGCMATPAFKSRYCSQHATRSTVLLEEETTGDDKTVVEMIIGDRQLRGTTYYQVVWLGKPDVHTSWEPESSLPSVAIEEYRKGLLLESVEKEKHQYGHKTHTIFTEEKASEVPQPATKKAHLERPVVSNTSGAFVDDKSTHTVCNTEKDKHIRMNLRTAGILAGSRPCGILVFLSELFTAESKTQVYGCLHTYYSQHPSTAERIEYICYDDACHLRKFSRNPIRANLTDCSKKLASTEMVVDKMHMKGHTDPWCKQHCDAMKFTDLEKVDTEVCEQLFSWLSRYSRITQKMSQHNFIFFCCTYSSYTMHMKRRS